MIFGCLLLLTFAIEGFLRARRDETLELSRALLIAHRSTGVVAESTARSGSEIVALDALNSERSSVALRGFGPTRDHAKDLLDLMPWFNFVGAPLYFVGDIEWARQESLAWTPVVTQDQVGRAESALGAAFARAKLWAHAISSSTYLAFLVLVGLLSAFVFRGGATLFMCGIRVHRIDGSRASRLRCTARAAAALLPSSILATNAIWMRYSLVTPAGLSSDVEWRTRQARLLVGQPEAFVGVVGHAPEVLMLAAIAALYAVVIHAIAHPEQSWHDRIAGTCLVPK
jgi:hypothetical protein